MDQHDKRYFWGHWKHNLNEISEIYKEIIGTKLVLDLEFSNRQHCISHSEDIVIGTARIPLSRACLGEESDKW